MFRVACGLLSIAKPYVDLSGVKSKRASQVESGDMVGRQDSATSTAASAALPQRRLPPLRRHPKRRAFTPTADQVPRQSQNLSF